MGLGTHRSGGIDGEDPRRSVVEKAVVETMEAVRDRFLRWRGATWVGGSRGHDDEARGWLRLPAV